MISSISKTLNIQLKRDYEEICQLLIKKEYVFDELPRNREAINEEGEAFSLANPIQGILKYHGFSDFKQQISFFPSISLNNGSLYTISYLRFDKELKNDIVFLNGTSADRITFQKVKGSLENIRNFSGINTKALLISRNIFPSKEEGKGLGTSASGSAALGLAATSILYDNIPEFINNRRLLSIFSRYLSGSGCRSSSGGFSLWLSHPTIDPLDSFAIQLNREEHQDFIDNISFLTIPIKSELKTAQAHNVSLKSPFFEAWLSKRKELIFKFIDALDSHDLSKIGDLAEYDTLCLHAITMTAPNNENIIAWDPDTLKVILEVRELRKSGYEVYFSIDTGPSLVLITNKSQAESIKKAIKPVIPQHEIIEGKLGGPSKLLNSNSPEVKLIKTDMERFIQ
jgi:diphosphomevalonate decarboxylase